MNLKRGGGRERERPKQMPTHGNILNLSPMRKINYTNGQRRETSQKTIGLQIQFLKLCATKTIFFGVQAEPDMTMRHPSLSVTEQRLRNSKEESIIYLICPEKNHSFFDKFGFQH